MEFKTHNYNFKITTSLRSIYNIAYKYAKTDYCILIIGPTGSGKENLAKSIHENSTRSSKPYVTYSCASISETLFEGEFFGHEKGSFTSADNSIRGIVEESAGGTIFLDELGLLSLTNQGKFLRLLSNPIYYSLGGKRKISSVRFIFAMNKDPNEMIENGSLRNDLYYRIAKFPSLILPPFRNYPNEEKLQILDCLNENISEDFNKDKLFFDDEAIKFILKYSFPGNIRELENCITSLLVLDFKRVTLNDLEYFLTPIENKRKIFCDNPWTLNINEVQKEVAKIAFDKSGGVWEKAAEQVGVNYRTLKEWLNYNERSSDNPTKHLTRK